MKTKSLPQRATKKELTAWYNTTHPTLIKWLSMIKELDAPRFDRAGYDRRQIKQIFDHLGTPDQFIQEEND